MARDEKRGETLRGRVRRVGAQLGRARQRPLLAKTGVTSDQAAPPPESESGARQGSETLVWEECARALGFELPKGHLEVQISHASEILGEDIRSDRIMLYCISYHISGIVGAPYLGAPSS